MKNHRLSVFEYKSFSKCPKIENYCSFDFDQKLQMHRFFPINHSQEKDLNNLVAPRKHQNNPEKNENEIFWERKVRKMALVCIVLNVASAL